MKVILNAALFLSSRLDKSEEMLAHFFFFAWLGNDFGDDGKQG